MHACPSCRRPLLAAPDRCPFCDAPSKLGRLASAAVLIATPFVLAACYGGPPKDYGCDSGDDSGDCGEGAE